MSNPYDATPAKDAYEVAQSGEAWQMQYMESYHFIFRNPNWGMNVLWGFLCLLSTQLIPVVGQLLFLGYYYEVVESLYRSNGTWYPDFDINRFGNYMSRAIGPFVASLVGAVVMVFVLFALIGVCALIPIAASSMTKDDSILVACGALAISIGVVGFLTIAVLGNLILSPMLLRGGLTGVFMESFQLGWAIDFVKRTWREMLIGTLFFMLVVFVAEFVGLLMLCIGIFATIAFTFIMHAHLQYQYYRVYLSRGGKPLPLDPNLTGKQLPPTVTF